MNDVQPDFSDRPREDVRRVVQCECPDPDHDCKNLAVDDGTTSPVLCTPCLYGCTV